MKKRSTFMALLMLLSLAAIGQVSAYQCLPSESPISPTMTFTPSAYIQSCFEFGGGNQYLYQQGNIHLEAVNFFQIDPGFQAGLMEPNGSMLMQMAQQPAGYDVFLMSGTSTSGLPRYKKVEFGVQLAPAIHDRIEAFVHPSPGNTATPLNPYLESKLDVQMIFTHESGLQRKTDAFYFQDFERNTGPSNDWDEVSTDHPMRVRFTPHLNGKWGVRTTVSVDGVVVAYLLPFSFEVVESGKPGFVSVHPNKRNLQRNNRIIYPVGHNFSSPYNGVGIWSASPSETNKAAKVDDWLSYQQNVIDFAEQGGKYIRTLQSAYSSLIEFENLGDYSNRLHFAWEQDKLLETCENYDLLMQFNLMQQEPIMKYGNFNMSRWDFGHWKQNGTIDPSDPFPAYCYYTYPGKEPREMYTDSDDLYYHKQRTRYYLSRYGYSPQIYAFELVNEPWHLGEVSPPQGSLLTGVTLDAATLDAIEYYHTSIASYIKNDLGHVNQLIGVGQASLLLTYPSSQDQSNPSWWSGLGDILDLSALNTSVDYVFYSEYADAPDKLILSKSGNNRLDVDNGENSHYARVSWLHELFGKPVMYSEAGHVNNSCNNYAGQYKDVMSFGFTGIAGFNMWPGFEIDPAQNIDDSFLWSSTIRAEKHMNGNDVIYTLASDGNNSGAWKQGREYEDFDGYEKIKEHQFYVSNDKLRAVGYVFNRTFNVFTAQNAVGCAYPVAPFSNSAFNQAKAISWNPNVMKIDGLHRNSWYTIDYYTYKEGNLLVSESQCLKSSVGGKLDLVHPHMQTTNNPVLWYVVKRQDCNGKMSGEEAYGSSDLEVEVDPTLSLRISPNPNAGVFNLQIGAEEGQAVSLKIFNMLGQQVYFDDHVIERQLTLDTGLKPGIYMIRIEDGQNEQTKKFVVQ